MNNIQELVERLTDMCATEEGSPWPHDVMQCLIDCRSLLQAPLPDDVSRICKELDEARRWRSSPENRHARIFPEAISMLERLAREQDSAEKALAACEQRIKELESKSGVQQTTIEADQTAFNAAIDFALDQCGSVEAADFLRAWREGDWDGIREAWPEFDLGTVDV